MKNNFKLNCLSSNSIKIIACVFMAIDHIGYILFPKIEILRILGRLSMPLFAYKIAEGAFYTKNKLRYFSLIFVLGVLFQVVFYVTEQSLYMGILITFSTSILTIYALQFFYKKVINGKIIEKVYSFILFASAVGLTYLLNLKLDIDYGFWGCMLAVFGSIFRFNGTKADGAKVYFTNHLLNLLPFTVGLILLCFSLGGIQYYALFSLPILLLYSGKRGKLNLKYLFYIFQSFNSVFYCRVS